MPLFKGSGCKSTPDKVLNYIMDSRKATLISSLNLDDNRSYSLQFRETAQLFDKGDRFDERKYYHFKLSCDQADHVSAAEHHQYAEALTSTLFPDNECVIATHTDTATVHSHIIVNAVSFADGRKLDIRNAQYTKMKDIANDLGHQMGFSVLDFRKPAKDRITSTERHIELKGGTSWKQELREVIALAIAETTTIQEFEAYLGEYGVTLTRNTDRTIAYKHPKKTKRSAGNAWVTHIRKEPSFMSLQRKDGVTAAEKLNLIAEQKQQELENTLLKAALAQSSEGCEKYLKESNSLLQRAELNRQIENEQRLQELKSLKQLHEKHLSEIHQTINEIKTADQKLELTISSQISNFADSIHASTTAQVQLALNGVYNDLTTLSERLQDAQRQYNDQFRHSNEQITQEHSKFLIEFKERQRSFFRLQGFKHFIFWTLPVLQIVNSVLLICFLSK